MPDDKDKDQLEEKLKAAQKAAKDAKPIADKGKAIKVQSKNGEKK